MFGPNRLLATRKREKVVREPGAGCLTIAFGIRGVVLAFERCLLQQPERSKDKDGLVLVRIGDGGGL